MQLIGIASAHCRRKCHAAANQTKSLKLSFNEHKGQVFGFNYLHLLDWQCFASNLPLILILLLFSIYLFVAFRFLFIFAALNHTKTHTRTRENTKSSQHFIFCFDFHCFAFVVNFSPKCVTSILFFLFLINNKRNEITVNDQRLITTDFCRRNSHLR